MIALRAFEAAARHRSVQRAAAELHVTPTAVSHQIRALEEDLGVGLFVRKPRQLVLTPSGTRLFEALRQGLDVIAAGVHGVRQDSAPRAVTLSATTAFAARWILPRLGALHRACPGVSIRVHATEAVVDLSRGEADLAIRFGDGQWPGLATHHLGEERYAAMGSPGLGLRRIEDLERQHLIQFDWGPGARSPAVWARWAKEAGIPRPATWVATRKSLSFSDEVQAIGAAAGGLGVGLLSLTLTRAEQESGTLVQGPGPVVSAGSYHLAAARGMQEEPGVREVWEWIVAECAAGDAGGDSAHPRSQSGTEVQPAPGIEDVHLLSHPVRRH